MNEHQVSHASKKRAISLDLARGYMLLLIVLAHVPLYLYTAEPGIMSRPESVHFIDGLINTFGELFIDNRARPLFAVLFGYGLVLTYESQMRKRRTIEDAMKTIRRRSMYLILFGIVLAVLIGGQDILMAYGVAGLLISWLLARTDKALIAVTSTLLCIYILYIPIIWGFVVRGNGSYGYGSEFSPDNHYLQLVMEALFFFPIIPIFIHFLFPILPAVLAGIWMGRKQLLTVSERHISSLKMIAVAGIIVSILGALPLVLIDEVWQPTLFVAGISNGVQIITGIAGGIGYAALFGLIGVQIKTPGLITYSLTALGKRSLTFFVFNEAVLVILLSPAALNFGGVLSNPVVTLIAIVVWIVSLVLATILEKSHKNGPLEMLMQRLVYRK